LENWEFHPRVASVVPQVVGDVLSEEKGVDVQLTAEDFYDIPREIFHNKQAMSTIRRLLVLDALR
jgi:hypothetical protein